MFSINKIKFSLLKYLYQNKKIIVTEQDFISIWKSDIFTLEIKNRKAIPKIIWAFYLSIGYNYFENNALAIIILEN